MTRDDVDNYVRKHAYMDVKNLERAWMNGHLGEARDIIAGMERRLAGVQRILEQDALRNWGPGHGE